MTLSIGVLLIILLVAIVLFSFDRIPADAVALGVLVSIVLTRLVTPKEAFSGFGSDTVMLILGLLIMTAALQRTGVIDWLGRVLVRVPGAHDARLLVTLTVAIGLLSSFMSNTAATAVFVPIVMGLALRTKVSPSKLLLPVAFASILSSSVTLISTSTNIVVTGLMQQHGMPGMGMFELTPVGVPIWIVGTAYVLTIGRRLIPARAPVPGTDSGDAVLPFLTEVVILPGSSLAGRTLADSALGRDLDITVLDVIRDKTDHIAPQADTRLRERDVLLVEGDRDEILRVKSMAGIDIKADVKLSDPEIGADELRLVEAIVLTRSPLLGRTLKDIAFRQRYGVQVLAINRHGETLRRKISQVPLRLGDVLLIQGRGHEIAALHDTGLFRVSSAVEFAPPKTGHARVAFAIFVLAIGLATFDVMPLSVSTLLGALLVFATGCITPEEAYREVDWRIVILIGSMLGLGAAMQATGAAKFLAALIVEYAGEIGPRGLLAGFFALTVLLTQPMSNQAAAVVVVPVAIQTALQTGYNPRTFVMMIAIAASCSYLTPLEPSCLMVYGPGQYRFRDFLKVGGLLTVAVALIALVMVPIVWPVEGP